MRRNTGRSLLKCQPSLKAKQPPFNAHFEVSRETTPRFLSSIKVSFQVPNSLAPTGRR
jgi:hypothetical protein